MVASAVLAAGLAAQVPAQPAPDTIRIWGHGSRTEDFAGNLVRQWNAAFSRVYPGAHFEVALRGDSAAIGGLYTGAADLALMGREIWPIEMEGFEQATDGKPLEISVMTGSLDVPHHAFALVIFVHKDNPLSKLTVAEADAIFGADHRRGPKNIRKWGELGLTGEWAAQDIDLYGYAIRQDQSQFFQQAVMGGSGKWNCALREFGDARGPAGSAAAAGQQILDALAKDRYGIAISSLAYRNADCRPLAMGRGDGQFVQPTRDMVAARSYPLVRPVSMVIRRQPGAPINPAIRRYLEFILSREGQQIVSRDGGYLPLTESIAQLERKKLE
jgi:phosphate transport system substrate-binding protein